MSGHSKWSTIKRQKGAADQKRGVTFTKISNAIAIAARTGGSGDPDTNPRLRAALDTARSVNMPKENVQRAIDAALGKLPGQILEEVVYEGFGPCKVAFYIEGVTDNKLRTTSEVKNLFDRSGGSLGGQGSTAYMFDKVGQIIVKSKGGVTDDEILDLIDQGAQDVEEYEDNGVKKYSVNTNPSELNIMSNNITRLGYEVEAQEQVLKPNLSVEITSVTQAQKVVGLVEKLEDHDDIQKVYTNMDLPDEIANQL